MIFAFYTVVISPHQIPLARELVKILGKENYRYVAAEPLNLDRTGLGWGNSLDEEWLVKAWVKRDEAIDILNNVEVLMTGVRDIDLMQRRANRGLKTIYCSERWFKPSFGILRLLKPSYFQTAIRFARLLRDNPNIFYFAIGVHAASDMARLCALLRGNFRSLFASPRLIVNQQPGTTLMAVESGDGKLFCLDKIRLWGYFVQNSSCSCVARQKRHVTKANEVKPHSVRVLWVGRLLRWKRVDSIVRAVIELAHDERKDGRRSSGVSLDIYGKGPMFKQIEKSAKKNSGIIKINPPVPINEVRNLMKTHDIYVLASNASEGWGAVVNEALAEGMKVIGTYEAGASATMLPLVNLFHAGDWCTLKDLLKSEIQDVSLGAWTPEGGALALKQFIGRFVQ